MQAVEMWEREVIALPMEEAFLDTGPRTSIWYRNNKLTRKIKSIAVQERPGEFLRVIINFASDENYRVFAAQPGYSGLLSGEYCSIQNELTIKVTLAEREKLGILLNYAYRYDRFPEEMLKEMKGILGINHERIDHTPSEEGPCAFAADSSSSIAHALYIGGLREPVPLEFPDNPTSP